jgi:hypothetical protein
MKWNNTFILNLRKLRNDDYEVTGCKWYKIKNGTEELIGTDYTYSAGPRSTDLLETDVVYFFVLSTSNYGDLRSTDKVISNLRSAIALMAYPNPVQTGSMLTIEGVTEGSPIEVYNQIGACVIRTIATGNPVTLTLNVPAGLYLIRTNNGEIKIVVNN